MRRFLVFAFVMLSLLDNGLVKEIGNVFFDRLFLSGVDLVWISDSLVFEVRIDEFFRAFLGKAFDVFSLELVFVFVGDVYD